MKAVEKARAAVRHLSEIESLGVFLGRRASTSCRAAGTLERSRNWSLQVPAEASDLKTVPGA